MRRILGFALILSYISMSQPARADLFGGDVAVLSQILANAIQQLSQLRSIVASGQEHLRMIEDIHRGINDSLELMRRIDPNTDPGTYREWQKAKSALTMLRHKYGEVVSSPDAPVQEDADASAAEAIALNNSVYQYSHEVHTISEDIKRHSHAVSPGGAQKLTAQSLGVMLQVLNQGLRTQATGLKLQAQALALKNRSDKERSRHWVNSSRTLQSDMKSAKAKFAIPRF